MPKDDEVYMPFSREERFGLVIERCRIAAAAVENEHIDVKACAELLRGIAVDLERHAVGIFGRDLRSEQAIAVTETGSAELVRLPPHTPAPWRTLAVVK